MKHSLRLKLLYSFMLVIIVTLIGVSFGVSLLIKEQIVANKQQELITKGTELAQTISSFQQETGSFEQLDDFLNNVDSFLNSRVWVVNSSRQVIAMSTPNRVMGPRMRGPGGPIPSGMDIGGKAPLMQQRGMRDLLNELAPVFDGAICTRIFDHPFYGEKMLVIAVPIQSASGGVSGAVILNAPIIAINEFMRHIYYYIGAAGLAAAFLALLVVRWLTRSIVRPIKAMQDTASAMARGDYNTRVTVENMDEVGHLGISLNALAQELSKYISEIEQAEKLRRDFVANVSHELRTPLTIIRGYTEALLDGTIDDPESVKKYHRLMREETVRLERLIKDLLDLSRLQSVNVPIEKEKIPLAAIADSVVNLMRQRATAKQVQLTTSLLPVPEIWGNGDRLTQLLLILLDNALKYTSPGGTITITTSLEKDGVVLKVIDTGVGIPQADLPRIWERFYKVDKSHCRSDEGTGLGLAIARQIVDLHQGQTEVISTPNQGTTFIIRFPLSPVKRSVNN